DLSAKCLEANPYDLPFAMIYLVDSDKDRVTLAGTSGIVAGASPQVGSLRDEGVWPFAKVINTHRPSIVSNLRATFGGLPSGAWNTPPNQALVLPITASAMTGKDALLVAGLNPFRLFDDGYRGFLELAATQIAASISNAQAYENE